MSFRDAERLFLRLFESVVDVTYAKSYGIVGQAQEGIDVYGRLRPPASNHDVANPQNDASMQHGDASPSPLQAHHYATLQSKRVANVSAGDIEGAVTKFLDGSWEVVPSSVELRWRPDDHQAAFTFSS